MTVENDTSYYSTGRIEELRKLADGASDKRLMVVMLGLIMTANENALTRQSWRNDVPGEWHGCSERAYLQFIIDQGYPACRVERLAAGITVEENDEQRTETDRDEGQQAASQEGVEFAADGPDVSDGDTGAA